MNSPRWPPSRRWIIRGVTALVVLALLTPVAISAVTYEPTNLQRGTVTQPADGDTVISVQGFHFEGQGSEKKPARLVGTGPRGNLKWVHNGSEIGATWFYDVDPLDNGNLLVTSTQPGETLVYEYNPETGEQLWSETLNIEDTHDVDLIDNGEALLVANMRHYNETSEVNEDRIFIYNRTQGEITWEWRFDDNYPETAGRDYTNDWTHVNDIDQISDDQFLVSPRNFDQVIIVNRTTDEIDQRLGEDGNHDILYEQHNPDYLESENGNPAFLVADSGNDRIVEYEFVDGEWQQVWVLGGHGELSWPRDADRLPNGNTLVTDTLNHRVIEVTPQGEIVWEFYAPWAPYDAERVPDDRQATSGSVASPTMSDLDVSGTYGVSGSAGLEPGTGDRPTFSVWLVGTFSGTPAENEVEWFAQRWAHITPWLRPVWMTGWDFLATVGAAVILLGWATSEAVYHRRTIRRRVGNFVRGE